MQELQVLNDKLDHLLKKYTALQAENLKLKNTISQQTESIKGLNEKLSRLEENMIGNQMGNGVLSDEDKDGMKKQLDNVIGEIDKILSTLND
jgi:predicted  nucleic acid-binding Zn-ribbon protein